MARPTFEEVQARRATVVAMRRQSMTFDKIGTVLGVSAQRAHKIYREALAVMPVQGVDEHRAEALDRIDEAQAQLRTIASDPRNGSRSRVEAWRAFCQWEERRARLLGLDAPTRRSVEILTSDVMTEAIRQLEAEIAAADAAERALGLLDELEAS